MTTILNCSGIDDDMAVEADNCRCNLHRNENIQKAARWNNTVSATTPRTTQEDSTAFHCFVIERGRPLQLGPWSPSITVRKSWKTRLLKLINGLMLVPDIRGVALEKGSPRAGIGWARTHRIVLTCN